MSRRDLFPRAEAPAGEQTTGNRRPATGQPAFRAHRSWVSAVGDCWALGGACYCGRRALAATSIVTALPLAVRTDAARIRTS